MAKLAIGRDKTALLCMDYMTGLIKGYNLEGSEMVRKAARVLTTARAAAIPVIYIVVRFREGYPEISPRNRMFSSIKESGSLRAGTPETEPHPDVAPQPGDLVVVKHRVGAFQETDLETILRAMSVETLVLFGIATSGVVLSTVRYAADADYELILLGDLCADPDPEVHGLLLEKVLTKQATVCSSEEFLAAIA